MAGLRWFKVSADLMRHRKSVALAGRLDDERAWAYVVQMWAWFCEQAGNGEQLGPDAAYLIARGAGWKGDADEFCRHLVAVGFLDTVPEGFRVHDWADWAGAHVEYQRRDAARKKAVRKTSHHASAGGPVDIQRPSNGCPAERPQECLSTLSVSVSSGGGVGEVKPPRLSPLPRRSEHLAEALPATTALLRSLDAGGFQAEYPKREAQGTVERAVAAVGVDLAASRVLAAVKAQRAQGKEPKPWLGWHLDAIQATGPPSGRGPQPVGTDFTKTLADLEG